MEGITIEKASDDYKTAHMAYRNFADRTREEYLNDNGGFVDFLRQAGVNHVKAIGLPNIELYVARLGQNGFASRTRKRRVVAIRSFLSFLFQGGYIDQNIAKRIVVPFVESSTPHVLMQSECKDSSRGGS